MLFLEIIIVIFFLGPCVEEFRFGRAQPVLTGQWRWCVETVNDKPARGWEVWGGDLSLVLRLSALFTARRPCLASCQG